jgi:hypothetical protein
MMMATKITIARKRVMASNDDEDNHDNDDDRNNKDDLDDSGNDDYNVDNNVDAVVWTNLVRAIFQ